MGGKKETLLLNLVFQNKIQRQKSYMIELKDLKGPLSKSSYYKWENKQCSKILKNTHNSSLLKP